MKFTTDSIHIEVDSKCDSSKWSDIICTPSGIPSLSKAYGKEIAGTPAIVHGAWKIGSPVVSEVGAPDRLVGIIKASYFFDNFDTCLM